MINKRAGNQAATSNSVFGRGYRLISRFFRDSRGVWSRVALLFGTLCVIKMVMLLGMKKQIFETHWRVGDQQWTWMNGAAFYLFAILAGANVWMLGTKCQGSGRRDIHLANGFLLLSGAVFIFLTFHSGDQSYLYLMRHHKPGWNVEANLILIFFFQWPFVAGWIFVYALLYYGLVRLKRDNLILWMTAVFATAYIASCLGDLKFYVEELVVADCLGVACLLAGRTNKSLGFGWCCLPLAGLIAVFVVLRPFAAQLISLTPEFLLIFGCSLGLFAGLTVLAWRSGLYAVWSWLLPFAFFSFLLLVNTNYSPAANYNKLLCLGLWLPRYFLGEFMLAAMVLVAAGLYRKIHPRGRLWWVDVLNLILIALAVVDLRLSRIMGARLDWQLLAFGDSPKMMWRMARPYLPSLVGLLVGLVLVYMMVLWLMGRWRLRGREGDIAVHLSQGTTFILSAFLLLGLVGGNMAVRDSAQEQTVFLLVKTSPLWKQAQNPPLDLKALTTSLDQLGMSGIKTANVGPSVRPARDLNVVLIFGESSYNQYLSLFGGVADTQPLLSQYRERMEIFPNFFSNFAGSIYARFATFAGLYPVKDFHKFTTDRVPVKGIFELLHDNGYQCSMFYSSYFDYTSFRNFLRGRGLDEMYDADSMPGQRTLEPVTWGLREEETLGAMQERIKKYSKDGQKFFLTYVPAAPHKPFDSIPDRFRKLKMTEYENYEPNYINELLYMDWIVTSILDELKADGLLDKTLVVITADHGEMLGVKGGPIGHGWAVTPELANIPLIIMDPDHPGYGVNETIGSEVDLLPTLMDKLGLPMPQDQLYQGASLYSPNVNADRLIYLNSFREYAIIRGRQIVSGDRESDRTGTNALRQVFEIKNEGAKTLFPTVDAGPPNVPVISAFDIFQENFLRNYDLYCRMVRQAR